MTLRNKIKRLIIQNLSYRKHITYYLNLFYTKIKLLAASNITLFEFRNFAENVYNGNL